MEGESLSDTDIQKPELFAELFFSVEPSGYVHFQFKCQLAGIMHMLNNTGGL